MDTSVRAVLRKFFGILSTTSLVSIFFVPSSDTILTIPDTILIRHIKSFNHIRQWLLLWNVIKTWPTHFRHTRVMHCRNNG